MRTPSIADLPSFERVRVNFFPERDVYVAVDEVPYGVSVALSVFEIQSSDIREEIVSRMRQAREDRMRNRVLPPDRHAWWPH